MKRLAALVVTIFLLAAPAAWAGGPTSVILVSPGTSRTAALYNSDTDYTALNRALGEETPLQPDPGAPDLHGGPGSAAINVTWLMHDVQVWRIDHVFLTADGGPWVETYSSYLGDIQFDQSGIVHRPANPEALRSLLDRLLQVPTQTAAPLPASVNTPAPVETATATGLHWGSLLVGLAVGVVLVVVVQLMRRARVN
jgi:hypothetical protein